MRLLVEVRIPVGVGNAGHLDGSLLPKMQNYLNNARPEAVYFGIADGQRTMYLIPNVARADRIPELAEPLRLDLKANAHCTPVINVEELEKAGAGIQKVVQARQ
jgi:hypothetical protein